MSTSASLRAALLILAVVVSPRSFAAPSAADLARWCDEKSDDFEYGMCQGFISGTLSGLQTGRDQVRAELPAGIAYAPVPRICIARSEVTNGRLRQLVLKCIAEASDPSRVDGGDLVAACIQAAFPCGRGERTATP
ncbi:MAG TPA: Rap1a/Tai family immunity protein [Burkholderiaceae bacterium]|nr:Rap1a/Tai family immunity protein [Burkholderiaceae bacterium]